MKIRFLDFLLQIGWHNSEVEYLLEVISWKTNYFRIFTANKFEIEVHYSVYRLITGIP